MQRLTPGKIRRILLGTAVAASAITVVGCALLWVLWHDRPTLDEIPLPTLARAAVEADDVTVTWFGVTTLLFDDGETQIMIDGFVSRPSLFDLLVRRPVESDAASIDYFLNEYRLRRLAAIIPIHSHFDHAMDVGAIANRSGASVLGSATSAEIGRGAGVPDEQIVIVDPGTEYAFGEFTVRFIRSAHAPVGWRGSVPIPGELDEPLVPPAALTAYPDGGSYSVVVSHSQGSTLVQGSAGFVESALDDLHVDAVMLGVGGLEGLGQEYMRNYWINTVTTTGAKIVVVVHFDDYTQPFGTIDLAPRFIDDLRETARTLRDLQNTWDSDTELYLPEFAVPIPIYRLEDPEV